jgi:hypothetical protein
MMEKTIPHWREWKQQKMADKHPPKPRRNNSTLAPLTPSSPTPAPQATLKDFLKSIPGYAPDANGAWVDPQPTPTVNLYDDFQSACTLLNELSPQQRILEAAGYMTVSHLHCESLKAVKCEILLSAALEGDVFDLA